VDSTPALVETPASTTWRTPRSRSRVSGLTRLHKHGPQTLTELSEHDRVSPDSMSQTVNRLTSAGYAVRTRAPDDRRKVLFRTTAEGDELASAARAQRNAWLDQRLQALSAEDRAVIARATALLNSIADS
jgi:DNA-binding MarR family transcriptional regulator